MAILRQAPPDQHIHAVSHDDLTSPQEADVVAVDQDVVAANADQPWGIIVDEIPTDNPPELITIYGDGAQIDLQDAISDQSVGTEIYSDGSGGYTTTEPTADGWKVGYIEGDEDGGNSSWLRVRIEKVEA